MRDRTHICSSEIYDWFSSSSSSQLTLGTKAQGWGCFADITRGLLEEIQERASRLCDRCYLGSRVDLSLSPFS